MINGFIARMITQPGRYAISSARMLMTGSFYFVEVDEEGVVHQLTPLGVRDDILRRQGWIGSEIVIDQRVLEPSLIPPAAAKEL